MSALRKHLSNLNLSCWSPIPGVQLTRAANPPPRCHHYMRSHGDFQLSRLPQHPHLSTHQRARPIQLVVSLVPAATLHGRQRGTRPADPSHPQHVPGFKRARPEVGSVCVCVHARVCTSPSLYICHFACCCLVPHLALESPVPMGEAPLRNDVVCLTT